MMVATELAVVVPSAEVLERGELRFSNEEIRVLEQPSSGSACRARGRGRAAVGDIVSLR